MQIRKGNISAMNLAVGTVDVKFPDRVVPGIWLLDSTRMDTLNINAPVICLFPDKGGEGVCLGRHYCKNYRPGATIKFGQNVEVTGDVTVTGRVTASNIP